MTNQDAQTKEVQDGSAARAQGDSVFVRMNETVGAAFLGILSIVLLAALLSLQKRYRELLLEVRK